MQRFFGVGLKVTALDYVEIIWHEVTTANSKIIWSSGGKH
jgi:hypothetical protein